MLIASGNFTLNSLPLQQFDLERTILVRRRAIHIPVHAQINKVERLPYLYQYSHCLTRSDCEPPAVRRFLEMSILSGGATTGLQCFGFGFQFILIRDECEPFR